MTNGAGAWELEIKYPEWGRYLVTATDRAGGHRAGQGRLHRLAGLGGARAEGGGRRGERPRLRGRQAGVRARRDGDPRDPHAAEGARPREPRVGLAGPAHRVDRGEGAGDALHLHRHRRRWRPNVYAHVTLLQPHAQTANDLPIRLYGVAPVKVVNPQTRLQPVLEVPGGAGAGERRPRSRVREATGRPMAYTLAVVDEGLLGLTRFQTPEPVGPLLRARGARGADLGPLRRRGRRLRRGDGADARDRRRRGGRPRQGPPRQPLPAHGPLPGPLPPRGEGHGHAPDRDPAVRGRGARDGGGRARRGLRRRREVRLRAPAR